MLFDYSALVNHRNRAAVRGSPSPIIGELAEILAERAMELTPRPRRVLDVGCRRGELQRVWRGRPPELWVNFEAAEQFLKLVDGAACLGAVEGLPFANDSFDLVSCRLFIHWLNDLPGWLARLSDVMTADGVLLLATPFSGLEILQRAFRAADLGVENRFSPLVDMPTLAALLMRCGFGEPVVDKEKLLLRYGSPLALMRDLRLNGEANALLARRKTFTSAAALRKALRLFAAENPGPEFTIEAEFLIAAAFNGKKK